MATSSLSRNAQAVAGGPQGMVIDQSTWNEEMRKAAPSKDDLNALVFEYLLIEGFSEAAVEFARETGLPHDIDHAMVHERMEIREAVEDGRVEEAVRRVNELDPEILDTNPPLLFHLHLLRLIELIRLDRIDEALQFATAELAPRGAQNPEFLLDLERTMALLAFPDLARFADDSPPHAAVTPTRPPPDAATLELLKDPAFAPIMALMRRSQRVRVAKELNAAILDSQGQGMETRLGGLVRMMNWGEEMISKAGVTLPGDERDKGRRWASAILSLETE
ncbi:CTLH/CRA C-terminal to lish motif domain-containing protein [Papiliotrema laurentii]|uniref:CTLH/CRA C-terminal to lish motif domain-containing protein n=1 Tax=Papiliotrema laurentii TaxID=5418 RepID=A0AAD9L988_PAPLA|nr:CTLH/CRA C-terminal to lish motif domain-containing protein [Papiliotrema laurentii]